MTTVRSSESELNRCIRLINYTTDHGAGFGRLVSDRVPRVPPFSTQKSMLASRRCQKARLQRIIAPIPLNLQGSNQSPALF